MLRCGRFSEFFFHQVMRGCHLLLEAMVCMLQDSGLMGLLCKVIGFWYVATGPRLALGLRIAFRNLYRVCVVGAIS